MRKMIKLCMVPPAGEARGKLIVPDTAFSSIVFVATKFGRIKDNVVGVITLSTCFVPPATATPFKNTPAV